MQWKVCPPARGEKVWTHYDDIQNECSDFPQIFKAYMNAKHPYSHGKVGNAECYLVSQSALVDFGVEWMIKNRE